MPDRAGNDLRGGDPAVRIAIQGERGAYSEEAAIGLYGQDIEVVPCRTLVDVFAALELGHVDGAAVPVENSRAGTVVEAYDLLVRHPFSVLGQRMQPIHHCLLATPGAKAHDIRRAYSHPQALAQCQEYLRELGIEPEAAYDTAGSAAMVAALGRTDVSAIASRRAAEIYGLQIVAADIEDAQDNTTLFYAVALAPRERVNHRRTVIAFSVPNRPKALFSCLQPMADEDLNLSKLESRPSGERPFEYIFYAVIDAGAEEPACARALARLEETASYYRLIGSF